MVQWVERSVGARGVVSSISIFSNLFSSTVQFFSVCAKNLRVVSSNPGHEDFLLYAFIFCI